MKRSFLPLLLTGLVCVGPVPGLRAQPTLQDHGSAMWAGAGLADAAGSFGRMASSDRRGHISVAVSQWYGLPELRPVHARAAARWTRTVWGSVGLSALSLEGYRRHEASTGLAMFVGSGVVETSVQVTLARAGEASARRAAAFSVNARYPISHRLSVAASIDPVLAAFSHREVGLEPRITVGAAWQATPYARLLVDRIHRSPDPPALAIGFGWRPHPSFEMRVGGSTRPVFRSVGILVHRRSVIFGLLASHHDPLGWTTGIGVEWSW